MKRKQKYNPDQIEMFPEVIKENFENTVNNYLTQYSLSGDVTGNVVTLINETGQKVIDGRNLRKINRELNNFAVDYNYRPEIEIAWSSLFNPFDKPHY